MNDTEFCSGNSWKISCEGNVLVEKYQMLHIHEKFVHEYAGYA